MTRRHTAPAVLLALACCVVGCAKSRYDQLKDLSSDVAERLRDEQSRVVALSADDATRSARIEHLNQLKYSLSATNVALGAVPRALPADQRDLAFDVIEEVYSTIDWNIPLGPTDVKKPMPSAFSGGTLRLDQLAPAGSR